MRQSVITYKQLNFLQELYPFCVFSKEMRNRTMKSSVLRSKEDYFGLCSCVVTYMLHHKYPIWSLIDVADNYVYKPTQGNVKENSLFDKKLKKPFYCLCVKIFQQILCILLHIVEFHKSPYSLTYVWIYIAEFMYIRNIKNTSVYISIL